MEKVTVQKFLSSHKLVVLDTSVFIYHFEADTHFTPLTIAIFEALEAGKCQGVLSSIVYHELLVKPKKANNIPLVLQYRAMLTVVPYLQFVSIEAEEAEVAAGLRVKYHLAPPDALVIACGLTHGATGFVTADKKLSQVKEIETLILR